MAAALPLPNMWWPVYKPLLHGALPNALEGHVFSRILSILLSPREFTRYRLRKQATTAADPGTK
ncbi:hypothetical protein DEO72_LG9g815 [Vigna unguiculata]|uniref:Uncharacterized protein n=1 Tax=Vigna unguiculata TaxID=3917 RepID=A0A4D6N037_VIGUN|nr:hypothetical protein DEO72_LG9g815 [Vigna unguiculata]